MSDPNLMSFSKASDDFLTRMLRELPRSLFDKGNIDDWNFILSKVKLMPDRIKNHLQLVLDTATHLNVNLSPMVQKRVAKLVSILLPDMADDQLYLLLQCKFTIIRQSVLDFMIAEQREKGSAAMIKILCEISSMLNEDWSIIESSIMALQNMRQLVPYKTVTDTWWKHGKSNIRAASISYLITASIYIKL